MKIKVIQALASDTVTNSWTDYLGWHPDYADVNGDVNFLDRQNVDCSGKGFLASILMEVDYDTDQLRYIYQCGKPASRHPEAECEDRKTTKSDAEKYFLPTLRHHHVRCEKGEVLKSFLLQVDYDLPGGHVWYNYSCCRL